MTTHEGAQAGAEPAARMGAAIASGREGNVPADAVLLAQETDHRLGANLSALAGSQVVTWIMSLLWTVVVPREVGPAGMGTLVTAWSATGVLGVLLGLGTRNFLVREMVARPAAAPALVGTAVILRLCLAPLFVAGTILYATYAHVGSEERLVLGLAAGATFLTLLADPVQATFQAVERMRFLAYSDIISKTLQSLVGVALAVLGYGAVGLTTCWLVAAGIIVILNAWWVRPMVRVEWRTDLRRMRSLVRASLAYYAFGLFYMLYLWIDSVMLALMAPPRVVGWYGVPTKLFATLMFVPVIISTAWLPRLVNAFEQGADRLRATARAPIELVIVLALPICVAAAMTAGPVIHLLYGSSYGPSVPVLVVLVLALPFMYLNIMLNQVLIAANRPMTWTWVMAGAALVNPVLNFVLIRVCQSRLHNGAIGASISLVLTEVLVVVVGTFVVGRRVLGSLSVGRLGRAGMAAGAMWGAMFVTRRFTAVAELAAGGAVFVALVGILRLATEEEVALMRAGVTRLRGMLVPAGGRGGRE